MALLPRTRNAPLTIKASVTSKSDKVLSAIQTILSESARLQSIDLKLGDQGQYPDVQRWNSHTVVETLSRSLRHAPNLESLIIVFSGHARGIGQNAFNGLLPQSPPRLIRLELTRCDIPWSAVPLPAGLRYLHLSDERSLFNREKRPSFPVFLESLKHLPALEDLKIVGFLPTAEHWCESTCSHPEHGSPIHLPLLRQLKLLDQPANIGLFTRLIHIPKTRDIYLNFDAEIDKNRFNDVLTNLRSTWKVPKEEHGFMASDIRHFSMAGHRLKTYEVLFERHSPYLPVSNAKLRICVDAPNSSHLDFLQPLKQHLNFASLSSMTILRVDRDRMGSSIWSTTFAECYKMHTIKIDESPFVVAMLSAHSWHCSVPVFPALKEITIEASGVQFRNPDSGDLQWFPVGDLVYALTKRFIILHPIQTLEITGRPYLCRMDYELLKRIPGLSVIGHEQDEGFFMDCEGDVAGCAEQASGKSSE